MSMAEIKIIVFLMYSDLHRESIGQDESPRTNQEYPTFNPDLDLSKTFPFG